MEHLFLHIRVFALSTPAFSFLSGQLFACNRNNLLEHAFHLRNLGSRSDGFCYFPLAFAQPSIRPFDTFPNWFASFASRSCADLFTLSPSVQIAAPRLRLFLLYSVFSFVVACSAFN